MKKLDLVWYENGKTCEDGLDFPDHLQLITRDKNGNLSDVIYIDNIDLEQAKHIHKNIKTLYGFDNQVSLEII